MNWNKNNNDNKPWGSGGGNNPWSGGSGGNSNNPDFEDTIKKAKERFGKFRIGRPRNIILLILIIVVIFQAIFLLTTILLQRVIKLWQGL